MIRASSMLNMSVVSRAYLPKPVMFVRVPVKVMHTDRRSGEVPSVMRFGCITGAERARGSTSERGGSMSATTRHSLICSRAASLRRRPRPGAGYASTVRESRTGGAPRPGQPRHREAARRPHARAASCGETVRYSVVVRNAFVVRYSVVLQLFFSCRVRRTVVRQLLPAPSSPGIPPEERRAAGRWS